MLNNPNCALWNCLANAHIPFQDKLLNQVKLSCDSCYSTNSGSEVAHSYESGYRHCEVGGLANYELGLRQQLKVSTTDGTHHGHQRLGRASVSSALAQTVSLMEFADFMK